MARGCAIDTRHTVSYPRFSFFFRRRWAVGYHCSLRANIFPQATKRSEGGGALASLTRPVTAHSFTIQGSMETVERRRGVRSFVPSELLATVGQRDGGLISFVPTSRLPAESKRSGVRLRSGTDWPVRYKSESRWTTALLSREGRSQYLGGGGARVASSGSLARGDSSLRAAPIFRSEGVPGGVLARRGLCAVATRCVACSLSASEERRMRTRPGREGVFPLRAAVTSSEPHAAVSRRSFRQARTPPSLSRAVRTALSRRAAVGFPASVFSWFFEKKVKAIWLILPVIICLSQSLSHASLSSGLFLSGSEPKLRTAH